MTFRAIVLGLLGVVVVCSLTYLNDVVLHQTPLIGNALPIGIYGLLLLFVLLMNPLLKRIHPRLTLSGPELSVALFIILVGCCIPGSGLMRHFTRDIALPYHYARTQPGWTAYKITEERKVNILEQMPPYMLVQVKPGREDAVINKYVATESIQDEHFPAKMARVPWLDWAPAFAFWTPFILLFLFAMVGLSAVVHRQWADHEQMPYPIVQFVHSLLPGKDNAISDIFRNRLFWIAMAAVLLIHTNNYLYAWFPKVLLLLPVGNTELNFTPLQQVMPTLITGGGLMFLKPKILFSVIAIAFLLATDVSLAIGLGLPLWALVVGLFFSYGIDMRGGDPSPSHMINFGAYIGIILVIWYVGRAYYADVFLRALWGRMKGKGLAAPEAILGARIYLVCLALFIIYGSVFAQLDWQLMLIYAVGMSVIYLVMARIVAETGYFLISPAFAPTQIITGLMGLVGIGPQVVMKMGMFTQALLVDPRETIMPFLANSMKQLDMQGVQVQRMLKWGMVSLAVAFVVAAPVTLFVQYNGGKVMADEWAGHWAVTRPFYAFQGTADRLNSQENLVPSLAVSGWARFTKINPAPRLIIAFVVGVGLVLICTAGRLYTTKWPLHPVFFLVWNTWPMPHFCASFLIGWLLKTVIMRFGGANIYRTLKPIAFGLIAGDLVAGLLNIVIGAIYFLITGQNPKEFTVLMY